MTLPGVVVQSLDTPPPRSVPTSTATWFVCGTSDRGPIGPVAVRSMAQFIKTFGDRQSYSLLYDALDVFFREGGNLAYVSRVVGPTPVVASVNLVDVSAGVSLVAKAIGPGAYANNWRLAVTNNTTSFSYQVQDTANGDAVLEQSPIFTSQAAAIQYSLLSSLVRLTLGATITLPETGNFALTNGTDDRSNVGDNQWAAALALFSSDLGPGQVSLPGRTTDTANSQVLEHVLITNRTAILDGADTSTVATLTGAVTAQRADDATACRNGGVFAPWVIVPGTTPSTVRSVPPSALVAALCARNDGSGGSPNVAPAGGNGLARYVTGLSQPNFSDTDRETLSDGGVNVIIWRYGGARLYGFRSAVDASGTDSRWLQLTNARLKNAITADCNVIAEDFMFNQLDGQGKTIATFGAALTGVMLPYYAKGSLYGATPGEAFNVDVGAQVNTIDTIAAGELHAVISYKDSPFAERVVIQIVKNAITENVS